MNGRENSAPMDSPKWCCSDKVMPAPKIATKTTRFLSTLSLNAPWNCVTMSAQNPSGEVLVWDSAVATLWRGKLASGGWGCFRYHDRKANHSRAKL